MEKARSTGITILGIFLLATGFMGVLYIVMNIFATINPTDEFLRGVLEKSQLDKTFWALPLSTSYIYLGYFLLIIGFFVSGIGVSNLKDWGRKLCLLLLGFDVFETIINSIFLEKPLVPKIPFLITTVRLFLV